VPRRSPGSAQCRRSSSPRRKINPRSGGTVYQVFHINQDARGIEHVTGTITPRHVTLADAAGNAYTLSGAPGYHCAAEVSGRRQRPRHGCRRSRAAERALITTSQGKSQGKPKTNLQAGH
jgi:hypothetical protein